MILEDDELRLRSAQLPADIGPAVKWYSDPEVLRFSEGEGTPPYDERIVARMFEFLADGGELYIIEVNDTDIWRPIGDAALLPDSLPIVIGDERYRSRGLGTRVLQLLIGRAASLGWEELKVSKVFAYNERALRLFEGAGFIRQELATDEAGHPTWSLHLRILPGKGHVPSVRQ